MEGAQREMPESKSISTNAHRDASVYEYESYLNDYIKVLWKWKYLILFGSVLPALVVYLLLFFSTTDYRLTYIYDVRDDKKTSGSNDKKTDVNLDVSSYISNWDLDRSNYGLFLGRFYGDENIAKLSTKLQKHGFTQRVAQPEQRPMKKLVTFQSEPSFADIDKMFRRKIDEFKQSRKLKASLLKMTIKCTSEKDMVPLSLAIKDNVEKTIPLYGIKDGIQSILKVYKQRILKFSSMESELGLSLEREKSMVDRLRNFKVESVDRRKGEIALQFDIGNKVEYLPLDCQIQAIRIKMIRLEEKLKEVKSTYSHYNELVALNEKLLHEIESNLSGHYTIQTFQDFLRNLATEYEDNRIRNHLNVYVNSIDNRITAGVPIRNSGVLPVPKATARTSGIVFIIALMASTFAAFLIERIRGAAE